MKWIIASLLLFAAGAQAAPYRLPPAAATCTVGGHAFPVHIAATDAERAQGFAGASPALIQHTAILFIYPLGEFRFDQDFSFGGGSNETPLASVHWYFNMRHMLAPLDIAFMDVDGRVLTVLRMVPGSRLYRPKRPYAAALEIAAGRADKLNLHDGVILRCADASPASE